MSNENQKPIMHTIKFRVDELYQKHKLASKGDAFAYWYIINRFGLSELEAAEACAVSGPNDKGLDATYFDDDLQQIYCFQFKYSESGNAVLGYEDATKLRSTLEFLTKKDLMDKVTSEALREALASIHERRAVEYGVIFYLVVLGTVAPEAKKEIGAIQSEYSEALQIVVHDSATIAEVVRQDQDTPQINTTITYVGDECMEHSDSHFTSLVVTIQAKELADMKQRFGNKLFNSNVRRFLGYKGANKGMLLTLQNKFERPRFWYYHNGVTAVCESYTQDAKSKTIHVNGLQIVNGCQTTVTLDDGRGYYYDDDPGPTLLLRLIRTKEDDEFLRTISQYTNTQSQVTNQDLASNDQIQKHLQNSFIGIGYFYERARGEWKALSTAERAKFTLNGVERRLANGDVAKSVMAFIGMPTEAKAKKQLQFMHSPVGGYYDLIFDVSRQVWEYLLAYQLLDYCEVRRGEFQGDYRDAERSGFQDLSPDEMENLKAKQFLLHSETHLAALLGEFVKEKVASAHFQDLCKLLESDNPKPIRYLHGIIEEILTQYFLERMRSHDIQLSRYFKSTRSWTDTRTHVRSQMRILAKVAKQDPLAIFGQMLTEEGVPAS